MKTGGAEPEVSEETKIGVSLTSLPGNFAAGAFGTAGLAGIAGSRVGIDINSGVVGSAGGQKGGVDIGLGGFGKAGEHHGSDGVVSIAFGFGNQGADIGHFGIV